MSTPEVVAWILAGPVGALLLAWLIYRKDSKRHDQ